MFRFLNIFFENIKKFLLHTHFFLTMLTHSQLVAKIDYGFDNLVRDFGLVVILRAHCKIDFATRKWHGVCRRELVCPVTFHSRVHFARIFSFSFFHPFFSFTFRKTRKAAVGMLIVPFPPFCAWARLKRGIKMS